MPNEHVHAHIPIDEMCKALAHEGDHAQAAMINGLGSELFIACQGERKFETQCCYISDLLNKGGIRLVKLLAEFIELREKEAK